MGQIKADLQGEQTGKMTWLEFSRLHAFAGADSDSGLLLRRRVNKPV